MQGAASPLLGSRLHDFGFRGCTCVEQSVIGGVAHLLNFNGTDTMSAAYYAQVRAVRFASLSASEISMTPLTRIVSAIGGIAHLLNFDGTDTMLVAYYAVRALQLHHHKVRGFVGSRSSPCLQMKALHAPSHDYTWLLFPLKICWACKSAT